MLPFSDTRIAFASKTDAELRKARLIYRLIASPFLVNLGTRLAILGLKLRLPIQGLIRSTVYAQFVGGESIERCARTIERLHAYGVGTILDYSVEGKESEEEFDRAANEILLTVERAAGDKRIPFAVFKVSGVGSSEVLMERSKEGLLNDSGSASWETLFGRVDKICAAAYDSGTRIFIDAEESWIQPAIDELALEMMRKYNKEKTIVFTTLQMYRHDRLAYLHALHKIAFDEGFYLGLKLVRGAYMEKERARAASLGLTDPIQPDKEHTDRDFDLALRFCLDSIEKISFCAGTHNEYSSAGLSDEMVKRGISPDNSGIWFSQLLGMSDHISFNLAHKGYNVAKYVPYGPVKDVLPYLTRRARENTSVAGQTSRELRLLTEEIERRRKIASKK
jgi:proline dehydrogenase